MSSSAKSSPSSTSKSAAAKEPEAIELPGYDEALEQGYLGVAVDQSPNEDYTVEGVTMRAKDGPPDVTVEAKPEASS